SIGELARPKQDPLRATLPAEVFPEGNLSALEDDEPSPGPPQRAPTPVPPQPGAGGGGVLPGPMQTAAARVGAGGAQARREGPGRRGRGVRGGGARVRGGVVRASHSASLMKALAGQVAVVTGASRGVGKGIALGLGEAGATVYVTGRSTNAGRIPGTIGET